MNNVTEPHEGLKRQPSVFEVPETVARNRKRELVAEPFPIEMQMRGADLLAIRIAVWRTAKVEPRENDDLSPSVLICTLSDIDSPPTNVKVESLSAVGRDQWCGDHSSKAREVSSILVRAMLLHCK